MRCRDATMLCYCDAFDFAATSAPPFADATPLPRAAAALMPMPRHAYFAATQLAAAAFMPGHAALCRQFTPC